MKFSRFSLKKIGGLFPVVFLVLTVTSHAADWTGNGGNTDWTNEANWSNGFPATDANANIPVGSGTVTIGAGVDANALQINQQGGTLNIESGGKLTVNQLNNEVCHFGNGAGEVELNIDGELFFVAGNGNNSATAKKQVAMFGLSSAMTTINLNAGGKISTGTYGGAYNDNNGSLSFGQGGNLTMNVYGTIQGHSVRLGNNVNVDGAKTVVNIYDGASIQGAYALHIGNTTNAVAEVVVNGGTLNSTGSGGFTIGNQANAKGTVTVKGSSMTGSTLVLGWLTGAEGTLNAEGGLIEFTTISAGSAYTSKSGDKSNTLGTVNLKDGGHIKANTINLGYYSTGILNIESSTAILERKSGSGGITITGGVGSSTYATAHGVINFTYAQTAPDNVYTFEHRVGTTASNNKVAIYHDTAGITKLTGNSTYINGTFLNKGTVIGAHEKALGNGILYVKGGVFQLDEAIARLSTGGIELATGMVNLHDGNVAEVNLTGAFSMTGGTMDLDINSISEFDYFMAAGGDLTLSGGIIDLKNGYSGFEGTLGSHGNEYAIFQGFAALGSEIVDGEGPVTINGYDKANWIAKITTDGKLVFETRPIPEPSAAILGLAGFGLALLRRKR